MQGKIVLVGGGARSGKSRFALAYAQRLGQRRLFVATAQAFDSEMEERIARHRQERGGAFITVEEPVQLGRVLRDANDRDVVVVDCLTLWLSNLLLQGLDVHAIEREIEDALVAIRGRSYSTVLVSNEVGMSLVPENALGRAFRDIAGTAHQRVCAVADEVYLAAMGLVVRLVPTPTVAYRPGEAP